MSLSESEHQAFLELWASLPQVPVRRRWIARYALTRRVRSAGRWVRHRALPLALLTYAAAMVAFAGLLFHDGYAAVAAGVVAGGAGFVAGAVWSSRRDSP